VATVRGPRAPLGVEVALAFAAGIATFAIVSVAVIVGNADGLVILTLGLCIAGTAAMFRYVGIMYAVPAALAAILAFDWFYIPPTHPHSFPDAENLANVLVAVAVGVLVGELAARAGRRADVSELARSGLADEQAALRRVATLVAEGVAAPELMAAVAEEAGTLLDVDGAWIEYYDEGDVVTAARWSKPGKDPPTFDRVKVDEAPVAAAVRRSGRVVRIDDFEEIQPRTVIAGEERAMSLVGAPITVEGSQWGLMLAWSRDAPLPDDAEQHLTDFTQLVATAIANSEARAEVRQLADEQAALRRVATLVAEGAPPRDLFQAVATEVGELFRADIAGITCYESDGTVRPVATWPWPPKATDVADLPDPWPQGGGVVEMIAKTGSPFRMDDYESRSGAALEYLRDQLGVVSSVGAPIVVEGGLWGAVTVHSTDRSRPLPPDAESRIEEFTELVATAIANTQARTDLAASRARIAAAADEERRRVVRDLHDGAQQRLVHTVVTLNMARTALEDESKDKEAGALLGEALQHAEEATGELRELAHGILPSMLTRGGLRAGVGALASRMPVPVETEILTDRLPPGVEATAYFVVAEALTNVAKHASADHASVLARLEDGELRVQVTDDGVGGADHEGSGLLGLQDRLDVLDGTLRVQSPADGGTRVVAAIPVR
jgi:signal transduction histidine kinase